MAQPESWKSTLLGDPVGSPAPPEQAPVTPAPSWKSALLTPPSPSDPLTAQEVTTGVPPGPGEGGDARQAADQKLVDEAFGENASAIGLMNLFKHGGGRVLESMSEFQKDEAVGRLADHLISSGVSSNEGILEFKSDEIVEALEDAGYTITSREVLPSARDLSPTIGGPAVPPITGFGLFESAPGPFTTPGELADMVGLEGTLRDKFISQMEQKGGRPAQQEVAEIGGLASVEKGMPWGIKLYQGLQQLGVVVPSIGVGGAVAAAEDVMSWSYDLPPGLSGEDASPDARIQNSIQDAWGIYKSLDRLSKSDIGVRLEGKIDTAYIPREKWKILATGNPRAFADEISSPIAFAARISARTGIPVSDIIRESVRAAKIQNETGESFANLMNGFYLSQWQEWNDVSEWAGATRTQQSHPGPREPGEKRYGVIRSAAEQALLNKEGRSDTERRLAAEVSAIPDADVPSRRVITGLHGQPYATTLPDRDKELENRLDAYDRESTIELAKDGGFGLIGKQMPELFAAIVDAEKAKYDGRGARITQYISEMGDYFVTEMPYDILSSILTPWAALDDGADYVNALVPDVVKDMSREPGQSNEEWSKKILDWGAYRVKEEPAFFFLDFYAGMQPVKSLIRKGIEHRPRFGLFWDQIGANINDSLAKSFTDLSRQMTPEMAAELSARAEAVAERPPSVYSEVNKPKLLTGRQDPVALLPEAAESLENQRASQLIIDMSAAEDARLGKGEPGQDLSMLALPALDSATDLVRERARKADSVDVDQIIEGRKSGREIVNSLTGNVIPTSPNVKVSGQGGVTSDVNALRSGNFIVRSTVERSASNTHPARQSLKAHIANDIIPSMQSAFDKVLETTSKRVTGTVSRMMEGINRALSDHPLPDADIVGVAGTRLRTEPGKTATHNVPIDIPIEGSSPIRMEASITITRPDKAVEKANLKLPEGQRENLFDATIDFTDKEGGSLITVVAKSRQELSQKILENYINEVQRLVRIEAKSIKQDPNKPDFLTSDLNNLANDLRLIKDYTNELGMEWARFEAAVRELDSLGEGVERAGLGGVVVRTQPSLSNVTRRMAKEAADNGSSTYASDLQRLADAIDDMDRFIESSNTTYISRTDPLQVMSKETAPGDFVSTAIYNMARGHKDAMIAQMGGLGLGADVAGRPRSAQSPGGAADVLAVQTKRKEVRRAEEPGRLFGEEAKRIKAQRAQQAFHMLFGGVSDAAKELRRAETLGAKRTPEEMRSEWTEAEKVIAAQKGFGSNLMKYYSSTTLGQRILEMASRGFGDRLLFQEMLYRTPAGDASMPGMPQSWKELAKKSKIGEPSIATWHSTYLHEMADLAANVRLKRQVDQEAGGFIARSRSESAAATLESAIYDVASDLGMTPKEWLDKYSIEQQAQSLVDMGVSDPAVYQMIGAGADASMKYATQGSMNPQKSFTMPKDAFNMVTALRENGGTLTPAAEFAFNAKAVAESANYAEGSKRSPKSKSDAESDSVVSRGFDSFISETMPAQDNPSKESVSKTREMKAPRNIHDFEAQGRPWWWWLASSAIDSLAIDVSTGKVPVHVGARGRFAGRKLGKFERQLWAITEVLERPFAIANIGPHIRDYFGDLLRMKQAGIPLSGFNKIAEFDKIESFLWLMTNPSRKLGPSIAHELLTEGRAANFLAEQVGNLMKDLNGETVTVNQKTMGRAIHALEKEAELHGYDNKYAFTGTLILESGRAQRFIEAAKRKEMDFQFSGPNGSRWSLGDIATPKVLFEGSWITIDQLDNLVSTGEVSPKRATLGAREFIYVLKDGVVWDNLTQQQKAALLLVNQKAAPLDKILFDQAIQLATSPDAVRLSLGEQGEGMVSAMLRASQGSLIKMATSWLSDYFDSRAMMSMLLDLYNTALKEGTEGDAAKAIAMMDKTLGDIAPGGGASSKKTFNLTAEGKYLFTESRLKERLTSKGVRFSEGASRKKLVSLQPDFTLSELVEIWKDTTPFGAEFRKLYNSGEVPGIIERFYRSKIWDDKLTYEQKIEYGLHDIRESSVNAALGLGSAMAKQKLIVYFRQNGLILTPLEKGELVKNAKEDAASLYIKGTPEYNAVVQRAVNLEKNYIDPVKDGGRELWPDLENNFLIHKSIHKYAKEQQQMLESLQNKMNKFHQYVKIGKVFNPVGGTVLRNWWGNALLLGQMSDIRWTLKYNKEAAQMIRQFSKTGIGSPEYIAARQAGYGRATAAGTEYADAAGIAEYQVNVLENSSHLSKGLSGEVMGKGQIDSLVENMMYGLEPKATKRRGKSLLGIPAKDLTPEQQFAQYRKTSEMRAPTSDWASGRTRSVGSRVLHTGKKYLVDKPVEAYGFVDDGAKLSYILELHRDHGFTIKEAVKKADETFMAYDDVAPIVNLFRNNAYAGAFSHPFLVWQVKAMELAANLLAKRPSRAFIFANVLQAHLQATAAMLNYDENELKSLSLRTGTVPAPLITSGVAARTKYGSSSDTIGGLDQLTERRMRGLEAGHLALEQEGFSLGPDIAGMYRFKQEPTTPIGTAMSWAAVASGEGSFAFNLLRKALDYTGFEESVADPTENWSGIGLLDFGLYAGMEALPAAIPSTLRLASAFTGEPVMGYKGEKHRALMSALGPIGGIVSPHKITIEDMDRIEWVMNKLFKEVSGEKAAVGSMAPLKSVGYQDLDGIARGDASAIDAVTEGGRSAAIYAAHEEWTKKDGLRDKLRSGDRDPKVLINSKVWLPAMLALSKERAPQILLDAVKEARTAWAEELIPLEIAKAKKKGRKKPLSAEELKKRIMPEINRRMKGKTVPGSKPPRKYMSDAGRMAWENYILQKSLVKLQSRLPLMESGMDTGGLLQEQPESGYIEGGLMEMITPPGE